MRVLILKSPGPSPVNHVWASMRKLLGAGNVVEYPYDPFLHCRKARGGLVALDNMGRPVAVEIGGGFMRSLRSNHTFPRSWCAEEDRGGGAHVHGDPDPRGFDLIVVNNPFDDFGRTFKVTEEILLRSIGRIPVLVADGYDDPLIRALYTLKGVALMKREILRPPKHLARMPHLARVLLSIRSPIRYYLSITSRSWVHTAVGVGGGGGLVVSKLARIVGVAFDGPRARSFNLSSWDDACLSGASGEKDYDVSFIASMTNPLRKLTYETLSRLSKRSGLKIYTSLGSDASQLAVPYSEYVDIISRSKISVSAPGAGFDTYRFWEIPCLGAALASWEPWIRIEDNFVDGESAIFFKDANEMVEKILWALRTGAWEDIAKRGRHWFMEKHTPLHRAKAILRVAEETWA